MSKGTVKYQIILPVKVRNELGIVPRAEVDIVKKGTKYILVVDLIAEITGNWRGKLQRRIHYIGLPREGQRTDKLRVCIDKTYSNRCLVGYENCLS